MARPGLGPAGVGVLALRAVALELRLDVLVFLRAEVLPAQRVCGRTVNTDTVSVSVCVGTTYTIFQTDLG